MTLKVSFLTASFEGRCAAWAFWGLRVAWASCFLLGFSACSKSGASAEEPSPQWKKVDVKLPVALQKKRARREQKRAEQLKRAAEIKARSRVKKMQEIFVKDDERSCLVDEDCTLTPAHCCDCSANGSLDAINIKRLSALLSRRISLCKNVNCAQALSTDMTCDARHAKCVQGICKAQVNAAASSVKGIGVEPIAIEKTP